MSEGPHRRIVMMAKIEADSWDDLYGHLRSIMTEMACNGKRLPKLSISGGYSSGHIIGCFEDESIDHDKWAADLDAHLENIRAQEEAVSADSEGSPE